MGSETILPRLLILEKGNILIKSPICNLMLWFCMSSHWDEMRECLWEVCKSHCSQLGALKAEKGHTLQGLEENCSQTPAWVPLGFSTSLQLLNDLIHGENWNWRWILPPHSHPSLRQQGQSHHSLARSLKHNYFPYFYFFFFSPGSSSWYFWMNFCQEIPTSTQLGLQPGEWGLSWGKSALANTSHHPWAPPHPPCSAEQYFLLSWILFGVEMHPTPQPVFPWFSKGLRLT